MGAETKQMSTHKFILNQDSIHLKGEESPIRCTSKILLSLSIMHVSLKPIIIKEQNRIQWQSNSANKAHSMDTNKAHTCSMKFVLRALYW